MKNKIDFFIILANIERIKTMSDISVHNSNKADLDLNDFKLEVLADFKIAMESREASLLGRKEVLTGKAKFGIFGDGKELAQIALARNFQKGDFRSGYYRDQTIVLALGEVTLQQYYSQMYAHTDIEHEPQSGGRQMNCHYGTRYINPDGTWKNMVDLKVSTTDLSPTASQMPRSIGLGLASKFYRNNPLLKELTQFSNNGNEVTFCTIGDASTSEGIFLEAINAAGVLQIPVVFSVWDDGHGISVPVELQTTKASISKALAGFQKQPDTNGLEIIKVNGWDYPALIRAYDKATKLAREQHIPVLVHVAELTQPQGHSTSGSHERYKSKERLEWEKEYDCNVQFEKWIIENKIANEEELEKIKADAKIAVRDAKNEAWKAYITPLKEELNEVIALIDAVLSENIFVNEINEIKNSLLSELDLYHHYMITAVKKIIRLFIHQPNAKVEDLKNWLAKQKDLNHDRYNSLLYTETFSSTSVKPVAPVYTEEKPVDGRIILRDNFDAILAKDNRVCIFGEDSGKIGGVNQGLEGLQAKYGEIRVFDTGIREATIMGKGVGMSIRGLRPIAEIQYLDYVVYGLMTLTDDLASLHYRTKGGQKAPIIIRTRGHRFEGIWHSGSPMGMLIHSLRGLVIAVPRNMTQAAGMYNTLLEAHDPALIVEPLMSYRKKELLPDNLGEFKTPIGIAEVLQEGTDVTLVTYGTCISIAEESITQLKQFGISVELIDIQTLLPFDLTGVIGKSITKTNRVVFMDEDVSGGATGFMMQKVLDEQNAYFHLDAQPKTLSAKDHRPAYGSDGNYFSKPNVEDVFDTIYNLMREGNPTKFPELY